VHRIADLHVAKRGEMAVAVSRDDGVARVARKDRAWEMTRSGVQLGVADAFDDDLIEADRRNDETGDRRPPRDARFALAEVDESRLANRPLRLGALPGCARIATRERTTGVRRAGVQEERAAEDAKQRPDATAHGA
jgi:hypothetical protein